MGVGAPAVAIVGAGLMGRWHAAAAARCGARLLAVCDADVERRDRLASRWRARACASLEDLLQLRPAVAHLCTPADSHAALAGALLDAGSDVVCEKPLASDAAAIEALYRRARLLGRRLCPVHQFTAQRGVDRLIDRSSELGAPRQIAFTFRSAGGRGLTAAGADRLLLEILPHPLSVLAKLQPRHRLAEVDWNLRSPAPGEVMLIGQHGDVPVSIAISLSARPTEASATVACERGSVRLDFFHGFSATQSGRPSRLDKAWRPFASSIGQLAAASVNAGRRALAWEPAYPGLRALFARFYASIESGGAAPFSDDEVIDVYRARDAIGAALAAAARR